VELDLGHLIRLVPTPRSGEAAPFDGSRNVEADLHRSRPQIRVERDEESAFVLDRRAALPGGRGLGGHVVVGEEQLVVGVEKVDEDLVVLLDGRRIRAHVEPIGDLDRASDRGSGLVESNARRDRSTLDGFLAAASSECESRKER
jgi:hypothetical protein